MKTIKQIFVIFFIVSLSWNSHAQPEAKTAQKTYVKLENPITTAYIKKHLSKQSPKLFLTPSIEKELIERLKTDPLMQSYNAYLNKKALEILSLPLPKHELEGFRLNVAHDMPHVLGTLSLLYRLDKNPKFLKRINEILLSVCAFPDWNPQHFLDVSELAYGVSMAIDWVGNDLPAPTVKLAKRALIEKALLTSFDTSGPRMWWIDDINNWNAVNHGGMIIAALAIADENPELAAKTISRALDKLPNSLEQYMPDGAHPEGPSYWKFGTLYTALASNALTTALGKDFGISKSKGFIQSADFRLLTTAPSGNCFNFADSDGIIDGETYVLFCWFAKQANNNLYVNPAYFENPQLTEDLTREDHEVHAGPGDIGRLSAMGLIWLSQLKDQPINELPLNWVAKGPAPIAVFQGGKQDSHQFYLAAKGGSAKVSHANMDAGSFIFELNGVRWVVDPGNQNYYNLNKIGFPLADYTQNSDRWNLLTKGNHGHSTITVNNSRHKADGFADIVDYKLGEMPQATIDLTETLNGLVASSKRTFIKENNHSLLIEDQIEVNDATKSITWAIMTIADVIPVENGAILKQDGKELHLDILSPNNMNVSIISMDPAPLAIDLNIKNLKRIEIRVPAYIIKNQGGLIKVRLSEK